MASFPSSVKSFPTIVDLVDSVLALHQNERGDEITAVETFLLSAVIPNDGWISFSVALTYAGADSPSFTAYVAGDATGYLSAGMRFRCVQTTTKHFIITAVSSYDSGNDRTTITIYGGTDFTLANATISSPYWSPVKAPYGFPLDPTKWTVTLSDASNRAQSSPAQDTWYQLNAALQLDIPIGAWDVRYAFMAGGRLATTQVEIYATLSTSNSSESDTELTSYAIGYSLGNTVTTMFMSWMTQSKRLVLSSKTTYYVLLKTGTASLTDIRHNNPEAPLKVKAICAYL